MPWERSPPLPRRARTVAGSNGGGLERRRARTAALGCQACRPGQSNAPPRQPSRWAPTRRGPPRPTGSNGGAVAAFAQPVARCSPIRNRMKEGRAGAPPNRSPGPSWSGAAGGGGDAKDRWLLSCREAGAEVCGGHLRRAVGVRRDVGCADRSWGWPPVGQGNHEDASAASGVPDAEGGGRRAG